MASIVNLFSRHAVAVGVKVVVRAGVTVARLLRLAAIVAVEDILEVRDMMNCGDETAMGALRSILLSCRLLTLLVWARCHNVAVV